MHSSVPQLARDGDALTMARSSVRLVGRVVCIVVEMDKDDFSSAMLEVKGSSYEFSKSRTTN
jgi:hypothetical protein